MNALDRLVRIANAAERFPDLEQPEVDYAAAYGEQCADTDGLAAVKPAPGGVEKIQGYASALNQRVNPMQQQMVQDMRQSQQKRLAELWPDTLPGYRPNDDMVHDLLRANLKLERRAEQAEHNLETAIRERDALRVELSQRMALPPRALRFSR